MKRALLGLIAVSAVACSGSSFSSGSGSGTGGGQTGGQWTGGGTSVGGAISTGGQTGSAGSVSAGGAIGSAGSGTGVAGGISAGGGANSNCDTLWQDYMRKLDQARTCSIDTAGTCSLDSFLPDACGCDVYVNPNSTDEPKSAYEKYTSAGCVNTTPCIGLCKVSAQVHCAVDSTGSRPVCTGN